MKTGGAIIFQYHQETFKEFIFEHWKGWQKKRLTWNKIIHDLYCTVKEKKWPKIIYPKKSPVWEKCLKMHEKITLSSSRSRPAPMSVTYWGISGCKWVGVEVWIKSGRADGFFRRADGWGNPKIICQTFHTDAAKTQPKSLWKCFPARYQIEMPILPLPNQNSNLRKACVIHPRLLIYHL